LHIGTNASLALGDATPDTAADGGGAADGDPEVGCDDGAEVRLAPLEQPALMIAGTTIAATRPDTRHR
jgi:hypothetical protein